MVAYTLNVFFLLRQSYTRDSPKIQTEILKVKNGWPFSEKTSGKKELVYRLGHHQDAQSPLESHIQTQKHTAQDEPFFNTHFAHPTDPIQQYRADAEDVFTKIGKTYQSIVSYSKKTYSTLKSAGKKVVSAVRITLLKMLRVHEYINTLVNPQWNMPTNSIKDLDTYAPTVIHSDIDLDDLKKYGR